MARTVKREERGRREPAALRRHDARRGAPGALLRRDRAEAGQPLADGGGGPGWGADQLLRASELPEVVDRPAAAEARIEEPIDSGRGPSSPISTIRPCRSRPLNLFAQCPRRYYLARYIGWEGPPSPERTGGPSAAEFGTWCMLCWPGRRDGAPAEALELVSRFHSSELGRRARRSTAHRTGVRLRDGHRGRGPARPDRPLVRRGRRTDSGGLQDGLRRRRKPDGAPRGTHCNCGSTPWRWSASPAGCPDRR